MRITDAQLTKLPKYARDEITRLRTLLWRANEKIDAFCEEVSFDSDDVIFSPSGYSDEYSQQIKATDRARCRFRTEKGSIDVCLREGLVYVNSNNGRVKITPSASNCFYVGIEK